MTRSPARDTSQHYVLDGEPCVDVTLVGTDQDGRVAARAWATFVCE
ncbi:hypothetical protein [Nocardia cyriacigeorgica]|nr:hypothetical protein [Nocardia cyriacigeorgica]